MRAGALGRVEAVSHDRVNQKLVLKSARMST